MLRLVEHGPGEIARICDEPRTPGPAWREQERHDRDGGGKTMKNEAAQQLGKRGGQETAKRHGKEHYSKAGKKGAAKRWGKK